VKRLSPRIFIPLCLALTLLLAASYFFLLDVAVFNRRHEADRLVSLDVACGVVHLESCQTLRPFDPDAGLCQVEAHWNFLPREIGKCLTDFNVGGGDSANGDHRDWIEFPAYAAMLPLLALAVALYWKRRHQKPDPARCFSIVMPCPEPPTNRQPLLNADVRHPHHPGSD